MGTKKKGSKGNKKKSAAPSYIDKIDPKLLKKLFKDPTINSKMSAGGMSSTTDPLIQAKINELNAVLNSAASEMRGRLASAISGGNDFADTLHNIYLDYGYPETLTFTNFWNMYRRFGIAKNVVDLPVDVGWMIEPTIESSDAFENEFEALNKQVSFWQRVKGLDKRQRVGRYAGMFMRVKDGRSPELPIDHRLVNGAGSLMQMIPLYEGQLEVSETEQKITDERYSQPTMYQFSSGSAGDRNEKTAASFQVHWTRIVPAAEGADNGGIYGIPALEAGYNSLMDLRKIIGAGGEGFYRNAAQSIIYTLRDTANAAVSPELLEAFNESSDEFIRDRMRRAQFVPGMDAKTLESALTSPEHHFKNALNDVAASASMPATIIIGMQTGRLASSEDSTSFLSGLNSRNANFTTDMVRDMIDWCIEWGVLSSADYEVLWSDLLELSDEQRLANGLQMAEANSKQFADGGDQIFTVKEIREQSGFEELEESIPMNDKAASETRKNNSEAIKNFSDSLTLPNLFEVKDFIAILSDPDSEEAKRILGTLKTPDVVEPMIEDGEGDND